MTVEDFFIVADFITFASLVLLAVIAISTLFYISNLKECKYKLPSGPRGVPILGNLLQMVKDPHLKFSQWARQYGKLYTVRMGTRPALFISDAVLLKELLGTMESTGKFKSDIVILLSHGLHGILSTNGDVWAEQRQFCLRSLRQLGYGQSMSMEPLILHEAHELCEWIRNRISTNLNGTVDLGRVVYQATINSLWSLVTGERFGLEDNNSGDLWSDWVKAMQYSVKSGLGFYPWLKHVAPELSGFKALDKACKNIHEFVGRKFEEHKSSFVDGQRRDLIDAYIEHMKKINEIGEDVDSSFRGETGLKNSLASVVELFAAGGETMAATLKWAVVYLSHDQEVQRKLQNEIDEVVGRDGDPTLVDKTRMPYTEAVVLETLRLSSIALIGAPQELIEDISFHNYLLPKGMILMPNLYHIHHDTDVWGDPEIFRPERFLSKEGQMLKDHLVPFQAGKRQCLGEQLAKHALFFILVKLFQQFCFRPDHDVSREDYFKPDAGMMLLPKCTKG